VHVKVPSCVAFAVHVPAVTFPTYAGFTSTSSCATLRSFTEGGTPARCSPPVYVTFTAALVLFPKQTAVPTKLAFKHAEAPTPPPPVTGQPGDTVPSGQSVQVDTLATHAPLLRLPA